jgi:hypothetical protein
LDISSFFSLSISSSLLVTRARASSVELSGVLTRCLVAGQVYPSPPKPRSPLPSRRSILPPRSASLNRSRTGAPEREGGLSIQRSRPRGSHGSPLSSPWAAPIFFRFSAFSETSCLRVPFEAPCKSGGIHCTAAYLSGHGTSAFQVVLLSQNEYAPTKQNIC